MRVAVTGAAGFIGSHLCDRLLADGHDVVGVDCFTPYYPRGVKEQNLHAARQQPRFQFFERDLAGAELADVFQNVEIVFHLAAMPGLVRSWTHFDEYNRANLTATHRLLETLKGVTTLRHFIYASTSSVYGKYASGAEDLPTKPSSPYGITKLAGEQLARVYAETFGLPVSVVRFFSVYGPRQRPEMGYHKFIDCILTGTPIPLTGDGKHLRGNTFVADCVDACVRLGAVAPGQTYNLGGGELVTVIDAIRLLEQIIGKPAIVQTMPSRAGDQIATAADVTKLSATTGWIPTTGVLAGLTAQVQWQRERL
jgi:nucleoside-diphosphate-sugar epimerase